MCKEMGLGRSRAPTRTRKGYRIEYDLGQCIVTAYLEIIWETPGQVLSPSRWSEPRAPNGRSSIPNSVSSLKSPYLIKQKPSNVILAVAVVLLAPDWSKVVLTPDLKIFGNS